MYIEEVLYETILKLSIIVCVDIVFINTCDEVLLWLRNNKPLHSIYYFPWWRRYKNELIYNSLLRKAKEEVWLDVDINRFIFINVYDDIFEDSMFNDVWSHCSSLTYLYQLTPEEEKCIKTDSQHKMYKFFAIDDDNLHEMVKIRMQDVMKLRKI